MKTAVVILNWNGKSFLQQFLPGLIACTEDDAEIIVADNASTDDSIRFMNEHFPDIRLICNSENGGFAKGYNDALKQVVSEYYILLNSDVEVTPGWVKPLEKLMDTDENIAACQPKILSFYERNKFEYAGAAGGFIDRLGYPFCRGRLFMSMEEDHGQYNDEMDIFWATGACMMVRSEVFHRYGGLDEDFFAHMEEIDFCWRIKNYGFSVKYCPGSLVYHVGGGTLPKSSARKTYLNFRNNFSLLYKNLPGSKIFPVFASRLLLDGIAAIKFLADGGFRDFIAVIRAHFAFYRRLPALHRKRRLHPHPNTGQIYKKSLVMEYYLRGKKKFTDLNSSKF